MSRGTPTMQLVLVRHGETDLNAQGRFQARVDVALNAAGVRQARAVAQTLEARRWAAVYSSTAARAAQTAATIAESIGASHQMLNELRERDLGQLDGLDKAGYRRCRPVEAQRLATDEAYAPPGGENMGSALSRFCRGLARITGDSRPAPGRSVLVVTHGGVLNVLARHLRDGSPRTGLVGHCRAVALLIEARGGVVAGSIRQ